MSPEPMVEEVLEEFYEELAMGRWQSVAALDLHEQMQVLIYSASKTAQWVVRLEQRTSG